MTNDVLVSGYRRRRPSRFIYRNKEMVPRLRPEPGERDMPKVIVPKGGSMVDPEFIRAFRANLKKGRIDPELAEKLGPDIAEIEAEASEASQIALQEVAEASQAGKEVATARDEHHNIRNKLREARAELKLAAAERRDTRRAKAEVRLLERQAQQAALAIASTKRAAKTERAEAKLAQAEAKRAKVDVSSAKQSLKQQKAMVNVAVLQQKRQLEKEQESLRLERITRKKQRMAEKARKVKARKKKSRRKLKLL